MLDNKRGYKEAWKYAREELKCSFQTLISPFFFLYIHAINRASNRAAKVLIHYSLITVIVTK